MATDTKAKTAEKKKTKSKESTLYYFYTQGCGWCKKVDPIVDTLISEGYDILKLDLADGNNRQLQEEVKKEYNHQCGTPYFVDAETGNTICGFREKDVLEKWAKGEEIPQPIKPKGMPPKIPLMGVDEKEIKAWKKEYSKWYKDNKDLPNIKKADELLEMPRPKSDPPRPPMQNATDESLQDWKKEYEKWTKENSHLPRIVDADTIIDRIKQAQTQQNNAPQVPPAVETTGGNLNPNQEARLQRVEQKLDKLIKHLGVK